MKCPFCKNTDLSMIEIEKDSKGRVIELVCKSCSKSWRINQS